MLVTKAMTMTLLLKPDNTSDAGDDDKNYDDDKNDDDDTSLET